MLQITLVEASELAQAFQNPPEAARPCYRVEVTSALRCGPNALQIRVTNTWANRLFGEHALPEADRKTWTTAPPLPANAELLPAGLLGPVSVLVLD